MMQHIPVMLEESVQIFADQSLSVFFDGTVGGGGFAKALLKAHSEIVTYYGCDRDKQALATARENLKDFKGKVELIHANFKDISTLLKERGIDCISGFFLTWECHPCN